MMFRRLVMILGAAASAASLAAYARYRKDIRSIRLAIESGSLIAQTEVGPIEYGEAGQGEPLLLIHGAGGGYDQGLLIGRDFGEGYRVIAPSRFGYLRTPIPDDASQATQAKTHVALLEHLGIDRAIVVGVSAGGPSAIELALQFPERVSALILLVPLTYEPSKQIGVDAAFESQVVLQLVERSADFFFWGWP